LVKKKELQLNEKELDKKILEQIAKEEAEKKQEQENKKELFKQQQLEVKKANDEKLKEKKDNKIKEKKLDKVMIEEYTQLLEKQENDNSRARRIMVNGRVVPGEYVKKVEEDRQKLSDMNKGYLAELEKIERRYIVFITL
jgi:hypothetical protein